MFGFYSTIVSLSRSILPIVFLLWAVPGFGQIVQSAFSTQGGAWPQPGGGCGSNACSTTPNFSSPVTVGNYIIVIPNACQVSNCTSTGTLVLTTVTDTLGNTFASCASLSGTQTFLDAYIWYAKITTGGTDAVTGQVATNQPQFGGVNAFEVSGIAATTPCDGHNATRGTVSGTTTSVAATTSQGGELSFVQIKTSSGCSTIPSGYSALANSAGAYKVLGASGTETATYSGCTNADVAEAAIATFKYSAAATAKNGITVLHAGP